MRKQGMAHFGGGAGTGRLIGKVRIMGDTILTYFSENLSTVSKEELLQVLQGALQSANYWREACLLGCLSGQAGAKELRSGRI